MRVGHSLADIAGDVAEIDAMPLRPLDLLNDDQPFGCIALDDGKSRSETRTQGRIGRLDRVFDVLRVIVAAANDDDVLDASGDEEFALFIQHAEISSP